MVRSRSRKPGYVSKLLLVAVFQLAVSSSVFSQDISAKASTDKSEYLVGDYINYTISVNCGKDLKIYPPALNTDSLKNISLIQKENPVEEEGNGTVNVIYKYVLSGYDSTGVIIPPVAVPYQSSGDSTIHFAYTNGVTFTIQTLKVNPQGEIKDIKPPIKILLDWKLILFWTLIALFFAGIIFYSYLLHRRKRAKSLSGMEVVNLPPHVIALNGLNELGEKKLWQKGMIKEYHSTITEIIRRYFENRFEMPAMELPTSEVIALLSRKQESEAIINTTHDFLSNADLVKFARFTPLSSVNEEMMKQAYEIVNKTIPAAETEMNASTGAIPDTERIHSDNAK